jgi:hypothetical protein
MAKKFFNEIENEFHYILRLFFVKTFSPKFPGSTILFRLRDTMTLYSVPYPRLGLASDREGLAF